MRPGDEAASPGGGWAVNGARNARAASLCEKSEIRNQKNDKGILHV